MHSKKLAKRFAAGKSTRAGLNDLPERRWRGRYDAEATAIDGRPLLRVKLTASASARNFAAD
jgi:hypothetical protein